MNHPLRGSAPAALRARPHGPGRNLPAPSPSAGAHGSRPPSVRAFTLIELMIAIGLGMLLVYTAVAGFRVASQTMTLANQLSLENALIRAGFTEAHQQLDFWTNLDDPDRADRQRLRGTVSLGGGMGDRITWMGMPRTVGLPFTPFSGTNGTLRPNQPMKTGMPTTDSAVPRFPNNLGTPQAPIIPLDGSPTTPANWLDKADSDIGFDPTFAWAPHDPRTWFRGNCIEKNRGNNGSIPELAYLPSTWFGRYAIFTNLDEGAALSLRTETVRTTPADGSTAYNTTYSATAQPPHRWYARQLIGLARALGFYGMCDYLPSNMIYTTYTSYSGNTSPGGLPQYFLPGQGFIGQGMNGIPALGLYALTVTQSYGIMNPYPRTVTDGDLAGEHYRYYDSDYSAYGAGTNRDRLQQFMQTTLGAELMMEQSPANWPSVTVGVARYIKSAKFANVARVRWTSPLTGNTAELSFTGVGTTLRGARMQRKPGGGWARWDNGSGASTNDAHLDTP